MLSLRASYEETSFRGFARRLRGGAVRQRRLYRLRAPYGDSTKYLSVQVGGSATFTFADPQRSLSLLWGSIDLYNTIQFFNNGTLVSTFTGGEIEPGANGNRGPDGTVYVPFTPGTLFNSFTLTDTSLDAFEVDNIRTSTTVPDGGTTVALLGLAMVAVVVVRAKLRTA